jgi:hypothetical protein
VYNSAINHKKWLRAEKLFSKKDGWTKRFIIPTTAGTGITGIAVGLTVALETIMFQGNRKRDKYDYILGIPVALTIWGGTFWSIKNHICKSKRQITKTLLLTPRQDLYTELPRTLVTHIMKQRYTTLSLDERLEQILLLIDTYLELNKENNL